MPTKEIKRNLDNFYKVPQRRLITLSESPIVSGEKEGDYSEITFPFSSELPVSRDYCEREVLINTETACDLSRVNNGGVNFLWNHNTDKVLGVVKSVFFKDKRAYCTIRWSSRKEVEDYKQDVKDGILNNVSFSYDVNKYSYEEKTDTFIGEKWLLLEVSLVTIPADHTVGINRSAEYKSNIKNIDKLKTMTETETIQKETSYGELSIEETRDQIRLEELERARQIRLLGKQHSLRELSEFLVEAGSTLEESRAKFLEELARKGSRPIATNVIVPTLGLGEKERKDYRITKAIQDVIDNSWNSKGYNSLEKEVHNAIAQKTGKSSHGIFFPSREMGVYASKDLNTGTIGAGGALVQTSVLGVEFIDLLRAESLTYKMGVRFLSGLQGNVSIPKQTSAGSVKWLGQNMRIPRSQLALDQVDLVARTLAGMQTYDRKLFIQSSLDVEQLIRQDLAILIAQAIDAAIINGSGINNEPLGILNNPDVNVVNLGSPNGGQITYAALVSMQVALENANANNLPSLGWVMNPGVKGKLLLTPTSPSGVEGNFILKEGSTTLLGHMFGSSNQVPGNLSKGSNIGNLGSIILGAWSQVLIGEWGVVEIVPNAMGETFDTGAVQVRAMQEVDIAFRNDLGFSIAKDVILV